jgi:uncharacterized membrane protein HdeD (DUF308 family)
VFVYLYNLNLLRRRFLNFNLMNILDRAKAPTPKFFKLLRTIGLVLATVGGAVLTAPVALPVIVTTVGGYLALAGGVISTVSQLVTPEDEKLLNTAEDDE